MNDALIGLTTTFAVIAVVLPLAVLHGSHRTQEVQEAWRKLADRHRLRYELHRSKTKVTGSLGGRPFQLHKSGSGDKASARMEVELGAGLPSGLQMKPIGRHESAHVEVLGVPVSEVDEGTGTVKIGGEVSVVATDPADLRGYLTPDRMRGALRLADAGGALDDHKLRVTVTKSMSDLEALDKVLRALAVVAPVLDTA